jgi:CRISPR-associated protein Cmr1
MQRVRSKIDPQQEQADWIEKSQTVIDEHRATVTCRLLTPMFGGGVQPGEIDRQLPIRAAGIRGQLRFWWRIACCEPGLSPQAMFQRECAIWGGIGKTQPTASRVRIRIQAEPVTDMQLVDSDRDGSWGLKYAFGPSATEVKKWLNHGYQFQLRLAYPSDLADEIKTTLRWWSSFGGIGARTRRGFGALDVTWASTPTTTGPARLDPVTENEVLDRGGLLQRRREREQRAYDAWKLAVDRLHRFRQGPGMGRRPPAAGDKRPRRSYWPEPDQLRQFTRKNANGKHMPEHKAGNVFPRAAFGMPILFDFRNPTEPPTLELAPDVAEGDGLANRMASPLILRPYLDGDQWRPAALLLPGWKKALTTPLRFGKADHQPKPWPADDEQCRRLAALIPPMAERGDDPLSAFMAFFMED